MEKEMKKEMKKKIIVLTGMVIMMGCMAACGASKEAVDESEIEEAKVLEDTEFSNDDFSISYTEGYFEVNEIRGYIQLSYCNKDIDFAGANEIIISKDENTTAGTVIKLIVGEDSMDNVSDGTVGEQAIPAKVYTRVTESPADSALTLVDSFMVMQYKDDVITIEVIRTVGQDDETDMAIEGAFTHTLESFNLNE